ncbi:DTW domain-containing protein YfiP [Treponema bryantii]|uniref:tRNA-uridine aminocarboxypropyltransferase n=1 Tax=Treponema bryantii TaxID=163 RepID=A0A1I3KMK1_9SPIR|nr:tRNA-uridine aminocarboxypropyltransferase [Treponema bryantii]SFI73722.1 DTW domain-containing protein YfiP [Treponema bryantii]
MSELCYNCFKPKSACLCSYTKEIDPGIKFVLLMHQKEAKRQRTGTGHIAKISLKDSEILVGFEFEHNKRLQELLADPQYFPVMMYPGEDAWTAKKEGFGEVLKGKKLLVLILDSTWFCARKLIEHNHFLLKLPRLSFYGDYRSIFTFKHEPRPEYISTIESCYYLIKEMQENGLCDKSIDPEPMMNAFKQMIKFQLQAENERILGIRPNSHNYDAKYNKLREIPTFD